MTSATIELLVPGDPAIATGGYAYARRLVAALRNAGHPVRWHRLADGFPAPDAAALDQAHETFARLPDGAVTVVDGLAYGAMPQLVARHAPRLRMVALVHHPLHAETGLAPSRMSALFAAESAALGHAQRVIVTSETTVAALEAMGVPRSRIAVVEPGTDPARLVHGRAGPDDPVALLCVATLTPRKGHDVLLDALARLPAHGWRLDAAGSAERDPATAAAVCTRIAQLGLGERVRLHGEVDAATLDALYARADVAVLASRMEGYGMALAEALARGLPVVATRAGAVVGTVPADAGRLVPVDDVGALADALTAVVTDDALRARLATGARAARARLPDWPSRADVFVRALGL
jgi:glycosyltransferase involved in cell wall biosynthesis